MTKPRRGQLVPPAGIHELPIHQQRQMQDAQERAMLDGKERFFASVDKIVPCSRNDQQCPKCRFPGEKLKKHCVGREPEEGIESECLIVGDHLHGKCGSCGYSWLERVAGDDLELEGRGALRYDEQMVEGVPTQVEVPDAYERWGVPRPEQKGKP